MWFVRPPGPAALPLCPRGKETYLSCTCPCSRKVSRKVQEELTVTALGQPSWKGAKLWEIQCCKDHNCLTTTTGQRIEGQAVRATQTLGRLSTTELHCQLSFQFVFETEPH